MSAWTLFVIWWIGTVIVILDFPALKSHEDRLSMRFRRIGLAATWPVVLWQMASREIAATMIESPPSSEAQAADTKE